MTESELNTMLFRLGVEFGVSPRLINDRLLSDEDRQDLLSVVTAITSLRAAIEVWRHSGCPDLIRPTTNQQDLTQTRSVA